MPAAKTPWEELIEVYHLSKTPYPDLKAITLAQWALESGYGTSALATEHFNFGGLKFRERMAAHALPVDYQAHDGEDTYCKFADYESFIAGYWHFIASGPYDGWEDYGDDPLGYIRHIHSKGYAADPAYVAKVAKVFEDIADDLGIGDQIDRPNKRDYGEDLAVVLEPVMGQSHKIRGSYENGLEGLIVHYDAGRIRPKYAADENSDWGSIKTIEWGARQGYRYLCISRTGRVFAPDNWDWDHWGSHAGRSKCPITARTWVSQYYVGVEMNNPGLLYEAQEDGVFCPWYNSRRRENGSVILDERGRCYRLDPRDEWFNRERVRYASGENIFPGYYLPYTRAQFEALKGVVALAKSERPDTFGYDFIFGHDEVSPGRKQDPGGALAHEDRLMTMTEFRAEVTPLVG